MLAANLVSLLCGLEINRLQIKYHRSIYQPLARQVPPTLFFSAKLIRVGFAVHWIPLTVGGVSGLLKARVALERLEFPILRVAQCGYNGGAAMSNRFWTIDAGLG